MSTQRHLRLAIVIGCVGALAVALLFPYLFSVMPTLPRRMQSSSLPMAMLISLQVIQAAAVFTLLSWIGLKLGAPLALDAPLLRGLVYRTAFTTKRNAFLLAIALGVGAAVLVAALDLWLKPLLPPSTHPLPEAVARWKGFLASFYGGIGEEIQLRLFLMTVLAWIGWKIAGRARPAIYWSAIILSALIFGAGHLPLAIEIWGRDSINYLRTIVLNALVGFPLGWLYWRYGLEYAMLAHFSADIILHVLSRT